MLQSPSNLLFCYWLFTAPLSKPYPNEDFDGYLYMPLDTEMNKISVRLF